MDVADVRSSAESQKGMNQESSSRYLASNFRSSLQLEVDEGEFEYMKIAPVSRPIAILRLFFSLGTSCAGET
jgi:hypothetical protein